MGPKNACSYADLAMGIIDQKAKYGGKIKPLLWWRYRDDIFDLWKQGLSALNAFTDYINILYPTIKFELVYSDSHLNVLDLTLHLVDGYIQTDVYSKPTDSHLYLKPTSAHPKHVFKAIPYGVATRLKRNCSNDEYLTTRLEEYKGYLIKQGYKRQLVDTQFDKVKKIPRDELLKTGNDKMKKIFPFVLRYNPNLPDINAILKKHWHIFESSPKLQESFPKDSIIASFRRSKNLKEILAPSKYKTDVDKFHRPNIKGCFVCDRKCDLCNNYFVKGKTFQSFKTGRTYFMKFDFQCTSSNVVYLISCKKCHLQYVGSTRTEFKVRFRNHKSAMRTNKKTCEVAIHYNSSPHVMQDFTFQCIDKVDPKTDLDRIEKILITKEAYWMAQLFCVFPNGLNKRFEIHSNKRINYGK